MNSSQLIDWFKEERRDFPWRKTRDPYAIWVSETMLQQTVAAVVVPYFERWLMRFPTIQALAGATIEEVMKAWEGLGYYSRARNLHKGAKKITSDLGGRFPDTLEGLAQIKGIGPYTQGAILSFAYRKKHPALDANALRVLSRFYAIEEEIWRSKIKRSMWNLAHSILPVDEHWLFNEALIELGAVICKPKPLCSECPLRRDCLGYQKGIAAQLPRLPIRSKITQLNRKVFVVISSSKTILVRKCSASGIMAGLTEFPYDEGLQTLEEKFGVSGQLIALLDDIVHYFTRYRVCLKTELHKIENEWDVDGHEWLTIPELKKRTFSSGHLKIARECYAHLAH